MLVELRIRDLGVIEDATMDLAPGLTVLTGETGAGKTMVLTGLSLLCGSRADATLVRHGATRAVIEGLVELPEGHDALDRAAEAGADIGEGLVLTRTLEAQGRSRAYVGGRAAPVSVLSDLAERIVAIHGQADQWRLRRADEHREVLDSFGGPELLTVRDQYQSHFAEHRAAVAEVNALEQAAAEREREADLLRLGLERIGDVDPLPGEDEALRVEDQRSSRSEELRFAAATARVALSGEDETDGQQSQSVFSALQRARAALETVAEADPEVAAFSSRVADLSYLAADLATDLGTYLESVDADPARLVWVQQRRATLSALTRVYGPSADDVIQWAHSAAARLADLESTADQIAAGHTKVAEALEARDQWATQLREARVEAAERLTGVITAEIANLEMTGSRVEVHVEPSEELGPHGGDVVELRLASGSGSTPRSISKAASGGELSRVMLAIEVATAAERGRTPTFVFDEVDAGVGGRAALAVGARLAALARTAQVVVVTHLAQVAAYADRHLVVERADDGRIVSSGVREVAGDERLGELARMLGGHDGSVAREHAKDLLDRATSDRA